MRRLRTMRKSHKLPISLAKFITFQFYRPWGLARCSQPNPLGRPPHQYKYSANTNQEVTVYVLDTGITPTHTDFEGRARVGPQFIHRNEAECDLNGHGTHVAGTIAGKRYGICKTCKLVGVKVLDGQGYGSTPNSVNGIRWVMRDCRDPFKCIISESPASHSVLMRFNLLFSLQT